MIRAVVILRHSPIQLACPSRKLHRRSPARVDGDRESTGPRRFLYIIPPTRVRKALASPPEAEEVVDHSLWERRARETGAHRSSRTGRGSPSFCRTKSQRSAYGKHPVDPSSRGYALWRRAGSRSTIGSAAQLLGLAPYVSGGDGMRSIQSFRSPAEPNSGPT